MEVNVLIRGDLFQMRPFTGARREAISVVMKQESAEDIVVGGNELGTKCPVKQRYQKSHPDEGPNFKEGNEPVCSSKMMGSTDLASPGAESEPSIPKDKLLEIVLSESNVDRAWKQVKANRGAPGVDGITIQQFPEVFREQWDALRIELMEGSCQPSPVRRAEIEKSDGGKRFLGIPRVLDRLIQQAIAQVIGPIFDSTFSEHSYGVLGFAPDVLHIRRCIGYRIRLNKAAGLRWIWICRNSLIGSITKS